MMHTDHAAAASPAGVGEASRIDLPQYVLVFRDDQPPKEHEFVSISDAAAAELMDKQYPRFAWSLYHVEGGRRRCVHRHAWPATTRPAERDGGHPAGTGERRSGE